MMAMITDPDPPVPVMSPFAEVHETHTGLVVLVGNKAYKTKKPIETAFLDYSTAELRERTCLREVELNRRLAPDTYLGVGRFADPGGGPAEPVVVMKRHPDNYRLATMVKHGLPVEAALADIADVLARFHDQAQRGRAIDAQGKVGSVSARWQDNLLELERFAGDVLEPESIRQVESLAWKYITGRAVLFTQRILDRRIVEGHGDLLADDIFCLPAGPELLDCLEFDDHLRCVDCIDDAAFLAMDLEFLGRKDLAEYFLECYRRCSGDNAPASLTDFYIAYRAVVRAKVDCMRFSQGNVEAATDASRHLSLAIEHLTAGVVRLGLIGGGPGTGKTTLAHGLAERVHAEVISTDDVRHELQKSDAISGDAGILDAGLYAPENVSAVYREVIRRADMLLTNGRSVILDATWRDPRHRDLAHELAEKTHSALLELVSTASLEAATDRVRRRPAGSSDATPEMVSALAATNGQWPDAHHIDTSRGLDASVDETEKLWRCAR
jgi:aminoglycoside phosphotransferase family enzyme/predicted kinase